MEPTPSGLRSAMAPLALRMQERIRRAQEAAAYPGARYKRNWIGEFRNEEIAVFYYVLYFDIMGIPVLQSRYGK